jgi:hypothetical protein
MRSSTCLAVLLAQLVLACGDDSATSDSASGATMVTTVPTAPTTGGDVPTTGSSVDGSASQTDGDPATTDDSDSGPKLDVGNDQPVACGCEFNYVWVANAEESTVSKINMETLVEEARYLTRQDGAGNPSRTSVSLAGDVAVANRHSGLVKFHADPADCKDTNGTPGIQTSTGKNDVLAWDQEECRAWYVPFDATNQRPVAWTQGTVGAGCSTSGEKVWTVMSEKKALFPGLGAPGGVIVSLVDGETGNIDKQITIPTFSGNSFGAYGGAVNLHGDLFFSSMGFDGGKPRQGLHRQLRLQGLGRPQGDRPLRHHRRPQRPRLAVLQRAQRQRRRPLRPRDRSGSSSRASTPAPASPRGPITSCGCPPTWASPRRHQHPRPRPLPRHRRLLHQGPQLRRRRLHVGRQLVRRRRGRQPAPARARPQVRHRTACRSSTRTTASTAPTPTPTSPATPSSTSPATPSSEAGPRHHGPIESS